jgi:hypothetical protein
MNGTRPTVHHLLRLDEDGLTFTEREGKISD